MAEVISLFPAQAGEGRRYREAFAVGAEAELAVRILSRIGWPHDLLVVIDGTAEGSTTVAALRAGETDVAEVIAHSTLATLSAARAAWRIANAVSTG